MFASGPVDEPLSGYGSGSGCSPAGETPLPVSALHAFWLRSITAPRITSTLLLADSMSSVKYRRGLAHNAAATVAAPSRAIPPNIRAACTAAA